jgi:hypothetical protein
MPLPESGLLPGKILSIEENIYTLQCPDKMLWKVILKCATEECREQQKNIKPQQPMMFVGAIK